MFVDQVSSILNYLTETPVQTYTVGESRIGKGQANASIQPRYRQHTRRRTGTLEKEICILDSSPSHRREGSGEGEVERDDSGESIGRVGGSAAGVDTLSLPSDFPAFLDTNGMTSSELYWKEVLFFDLNDRIEWLNEPLGTLDSDDTPVSSTSDPHVRHCFNCGSVQHEVKGCPGPLNRELIALSRSMFQFFRSESSERTERLYTVEEWKNTRLRWLDEFVPGEIHGTVLHEALALNPEDSDKDLPWFHAMLLWGYPKGWFSVRDPRKLLRDRILYDVEVPEDDDNESFFIFGDTDENAEELNISSKSISKDFQSHNEEMSCVCDTDASPRRWASFRTTLFDSDKLPIYSGYSLPPVGAVSDSNSTFTPERQALWASIVSGQFPLTRSTQSPAGTNIFPWRLPGAFTWDISKPSSENLYSPFSSSIIKEEHCIEAEEQDMDLSD